MMKSPAKSPFEGALAEIAIFISLFQSQKR